MTVPVRVNSPATNAPPKRPWRKVGVSGGGRHQFPQARFPSPEPIPNPSQPGLQPAAAAEEAAGGAAPTAEFAGGGAVLALRDVGLELALLCARSARVLGRDARRPGMKVASDVRGP